MKLVLVFLVVFVSLSVSAQELNCQVSVVSNPALDVSTVEKEIFQELEQKVFELMNGTSWTQAEFEVEERINCIMQISITAIPSTGNYEANLQVQSTRPAFNTTYNSTLFNFLDEDVQFSFQRNAQLLFTENQFTSNLTSILAFYAYYLIGLDADTFSLKGGRSYLNQAQNIVTLAQNGGGAGWRASEKGRRNRYWLIENALQELFEPLRVCFYEYHRNGIDQLYNDQDKARQAIYESLQKLLPVNSARPGSVNLLNFLQAKLNELKGIYKDADQRQKSDVVNLLKRLDPANSSKYQEILE
ncbi:MAG: DUF4835 domain-containing protein [Fluviicola sp.]|nr:MAG: DUF4835 domain-containing protein [Fluviicola sp.]